MIIHLGKLDSMLPTYKFSGISEQEIVNYYLRYLKDRRPDFLEQEIDPQEKWMKFSGDFAEADTDEEIYLRASKNAHLYMEE
jgi:hypothetical protein